MCLVCLIMKIRLILILGLGKILKDLWIEGLESRDRVYKLRNLGFEVSGFRDSE